jgi:hypothetical protein
VLIFSRRRRATAALLISGLFVAGAGGLPSGAFAQQAATNTAPTDWGDPAGDHGDRQPEERDGRGQDPPGAGLAKGTGAAHAHLDSQREAARNHAEREQQQLHEAIRAKFKSFDAALRRAVLDAQLEQRRQRQASRQGHQLRDGPAWTTANTSAVRAISTSTIRTGPNRGPSLPPMPASVRQASTDAPQNPLGGHSLPTRLGGGAPYDPKKGALSGTTVNRRL